MRTTESGSDQAAKRKQAGRPAYAPTDKERAQVRMLAAMGLRQDEIAPVIGVSEPTLRKHFWTELQRGKPEAIAKVAHSLYRMATHPEKPNVVAAIFFLKAQAGWRDNDSLPGGKKEEVDKRAKTAHEGAEWGGLLRVK